MTTLAELKAKVEAGVQAALVPALFARAVKVHEKHAWRSCECDWCERKREWHNHLQFSPHGMHRDMRENWRYFNVKRAREDLAEEERNVLS